MYYEGRVRMNSLKCTYFLCNCEAVKFFDLEETDTASCHFHFNVRIGEALKEMELTKVINKTWDEENKQYIYNLNNDNFMD